MYVLYTQCLLAQFRYGWDFDFDCYAKEEYRKKIGIKNDESERWSPKNFDECLVENEQ